MEKLDITLESLDKIRNLIKKMQDLPESQIEEVYFGDFAPLVLVDYYLLEDVKSQHLMSNNMIQEYKDVIQDMWDHMYDNYYTKEKINQLYDINNRQIEECEKANKNLIQSFHESIFDIYGVGEHDDKKTLKHLRKAMHFYQNTYEQNGALRAVNKLCEMADEIKNAVVEGNLSKNTARELFGPLEIIKNHMFEDEYQKSAIEDFNNILQYNTSKYIEKTTEAYQTQKETEQLQKTDAVLNRNSKENPFIRNMEQKARDNEHRQKIFGKPKARTGMNKQKTSSLSDLEWHQKVENDGRSRIEAFKQKYDLSIEGRKKYTKQQWEEILSTELGYSDLEEQYKKDFRRGMNDFYYNNDNKTTIFMDGIQRVKERTERNRGQFFMSQDNFKE